MDDTFNSNSRAKNAQSPDEPMHWYMWHVFSPQNFAETSVTAVAVL